MLQRPNVITILALAEPDEGFLMPRTSARELVVLGTASQVPTKRRNHNGYVLHWDDETILFDPGEGTQRQLAYAGVAASDLTRIAITHLHGDHSLGLAGVVQRISLDGSPRVVPVSFPASGEHWIRNLCDSTAFYHRERVVLQCLDRDGVVERLPGEPATTLTTRRLDHTIEAYGYRLDEPDGRSFAPAKLAEAGVRGPDVGRLERDGAIDLNGRIVRIEEVTVPRHGQSMAFVMDTRMCNAVGELADGVDLLVIESTYLDADRHLATEHGHLTALQAAEVAAAADVRHLVLTHFSQRYPDPGDGEFERVFEAEVRKAYDGPVTIARDLDRVPVPSRR